MKLGKIHELGIMQGRLLPKYQGRYQAHPVGYWQEEFALAAQRDLDHIEFILDYNEVEKNPLMSENGMREIQNIVQRTGVGVRSVCADYFMEAPLHSADRTQAETSAGILQLLIKNAASLGVSDIVIPCVDQSTLKTPEDQNRFIQVLNQHRSFYEDHGVRMALETDLDPVAFATLLDALPSPLVTVNYDTGNSAALGYDLEQEFSSYGNRISDIHIKDRALHGGSVELGNGNTDFAAFFSQLNSMSYNGIFVMQVFRDDEGLEVFDKQLQWLRKIANTSAEI